MSDNYCCDIRLCLSDALEYNFQDFLPKELVEQCDDTKIREYIFNNILTNYIEIYYKKCTDFLESDWRWLG